MKASGRRGTGIALIAEMIFSVMTIPLALGFTSNEIAGTLEEEKLRIMLSSVFICQVFACLFRARSARLEGKPKSKITLQRICAVIYLVCAVLPLLMRYKVDISLLQNQEALKKAVEGGGIGFTGDVRQIVGAIVWLTVMLRLAFNFLERKKQRWYFIALGVLLGLLCVIFLVYSLLTADIAIAMILIALMALGSILRVIFRRIRLDVLRRIVQQTYAAEIILGLLMLIFACAYVLRYMDPNITSFEDGLWYCFAIVTTIGFGDITATSLIGRVLSVILGIYGIIVVALITSIIVNFYTEVEKSRKQEEEGRRKISPNRRRRGRRRRRRRNAARGGTQGNGIIVIRKAPGKAGENRDETNDDKPDNPVNDSGAD